MDQNRVKEKRKKFYQREKEGSLTVEAAFVMPLFLYFMIAFLYFIQIFTIQEHIQSGITRMGLSLSKTAYLFDEFPSLDEAFSFDQTVFGTDFELELQEFLQTSTEGALLNAYAPRFLDVERINHTCIQNGFRGISFYSTGIMDGKDDIDIIVRYRVSLPIKLFQIGDMRMIQRVRVRAWTGVQKEALYRKSDESASEETIVYVTTTGTVYHTSKDCSHIKLSVRSVSGIPTDITNDNGHTYSQCESCCHGELDPLATYYITSDGIKFHTVVNCSRIKRNITEIRLSEIGERRKCKRCAGK